MNSNTNASVSLKKFALKYGAEIRDVAFAVVAVKTWNMIILSRSQRAAAILRGILSYCAKIAIVPKAIIFNRLVVEEKN
jgi:hypothetical protein